MGGVVSPPLQDGYSRPVPFRSDSLRLWTMVPVAGFKGQWPSPTGQAVYTGGGGRGTSKIRAREGSECLPVLRIIPRPLGTEVEGPVLVGGTRVGRNTFQGI